MATGFNDNSEYLGRNHTQQLTDFPTADVAEAVAHARRGVSGSGPCQQSLDAGRLEDPEWRQELLRWQAGKGHAAVKERARTITRRQQPSQRTQR